MSNDMNFKHKLHDEATEITHEVEIKVDAQSVRLVLPNDDPTAGSPEHAAIEIFDGKLCVHMWADGCDAPDSIRLPLHELLDPDNDTPEFEHLEGEC